MQNSKRSNGLGLAALGVVATLMLGGTAQAAAVKWLRAADFATDITAPTRLSIGGVSQDGTTYYGTIRLVTGSATDRAFYYRNGVLTTIEGLGDATSARGISADGSVLLANATVPSAGLAKAFYVTHLGAGNETKTFIEPPAGFTGTTVTGSGTPLSADGLVAGLAATVKVGPVTTFSAQTWKPSIGFAVVPGASADAPTAVSANGAVVAGGNIAYRVKNGVTLTLNSGINNTGDPLTSPRVISADGNTITVAGGLWHENVNNLPNFQNFQALPGYSGHAGFSDDGGNFSLTMVSVASNELNVNAMTPDASWVAGDAPNNGSTQDGWIWSAATNTTYNITDFLSSHGVDVAGLLPTAENNAADYLATITGLALNDDQLTIVGVGNASSNRNGWAVTVAVPEPGVACFGGIGAMLLLGARRRRI